MKKLFGGLNISWPALIIWAVIAGVYTGIVAMVPAFRDKSFQDIAISFEWWILFGTIIIMNSKSPLDSALKCFIFFLISQPLVYLTEVLIGHSDGWGLFRYYKGWFSWTVLTFPMGFIGHYLKKDKWWGLLILTPVLIFLGFHYSGFLNEALTFFPNHLLSAIFCAACIIIFPLCIFNNKTVKYIGLAISIIIVSGYTTLTLMNPSQGYKTTVLVSSEENYNFNDQYKVSLSDEKFGKVYIVYEDNIESYMVNAEFKKTGNVELILESPEGKKYTFTLTVKRNSYDIELKQ